jgi:predicted RNA-binding protein associated with RNAse of E/G family
MMMAERRSAARQGRTVTVRKLSARGEVMFVYEGVVAATLAAGVRVDAEWTRARMELGYTTFEPGDRFIEWFYTDRWYNIMEVRERDGALKGWYCNVTWPAEITQDTVSYRDLTLDLWVAPDGSALTLDMDEFEADESLSTVERAHALAALDELRAHLARGEAPFDALSKARV